MSMSIGIGARPVLNPADSLPGGIGSGLKSPGAPAFADALAGAVRSVEQAQHGAQEAIARFISSGEGDVHSVAIEAQRAEISMELFQQVRNKFVSAYQEIMKMPM